MVNQESDNKPSLDRSLPESLQEQLASRRRVLAGSGVVLGGALGVMPGSVGATTGGAGSGHATSADEDGADEVSDVDVLNFALTLEMLEDAFYRDAILSEETTLTASTLDGFSDRILDSVYEYLEIIAEHEATHVEVISDTIEDLGGEPVSGLEFEFNVPRGDEADPDAFFAIAQALENTGVMAYDGAVHLIDDPDLQTAAATIATVEARHASYLNLLNGDVPFPAAFDEAKSMDEIAEVAEQFIVDD